MYRLTKHRDALLQFDLESRGPEGHRFSVVLGPNGTGKSQLLRSIAEFHRVGSPAWKARKTDDAENQPSALLVLSNMVTDVFVNTSARRDTYRYLGLRQASNNTSTGALRDATTAAILECFALPRGENRLEPVLSVLGGTGFLASSDRKPSKSKPSNAAALTQRFVEDIEKDEDRTHHTSSEALLLEVRGFDRLLNLNGDMYQMDGPELSKFWEICARFQLEPTDLLRLLRRLGLTTVRVKIRIGARVVDLDELSTGQLLLLSSIARIAAHVRPGSLVLIDEPEAGLHPNWQSAWIPLMRQTIPAEFGCHLFIATHSPYLVSDADDVLVPDARWGSFVQFEEPFHGRSVENILYRVFGARVSGNLMVEGDLGTVVHMLSRARLGLTVEDRQEVEDALERLQRMQGADTKDLNRIIGQAEEVLRS